MRSTGKAKIDLNLELALKGTDGWATTAQTAFRAGFAFKSTEIITLDADFVIASLAGKTYTGSQATGIVGAGKQVTAVGGFVFDYYGNGLLRTIKIYSTAQTSCGAPGAVMTDATQADGFYFMEVPDGTKWWVGVCNAGVLESGRYIDHKLAKKEFDEEDFSINVP